MKKRSRTNSAGQTLESLNTSCSAEHPRQIDQMSIFLGRYEFLGPYLDPADVQNQPGLVAVLLQLDIDLELAELNESAELRQAAIAADLDQRPSGGVVSFAVHYTYDMTEAKRRQLRDEIMKEFEEID